MRLSQIVVYPVKSCAGIPVNEWDLDDRGLRYDRSFMVVDAAGTFLTQREYPALALIQPQFHGEELLIRSPTGEHVNLPLDPDGGSQRSVTVWEHSGPALDVGDEAAALISGLVGADVRVVTFADDHDRTVSDTHTDPGRPLGFADGYPLLITGEASLADLNSRLPQPLPMNRFRPNLVVSGSGPFAEDRWLRIRVGDVEIDVVKPCIRCTITTVDQSLGERAGAEPLRVLGTFRRAERGVMFGQNAAHRCVGRLRVGDPVGVVSLRTEDPSE